MGQLQFERSNYWANRFNRRRLIGGAATAGVGLAAAGIVGCGGDDSTSTPTRAATTGSSATAAGSPAASKTAAATPAAKAGGTYRSSSSNATYDSFDASRSRFTPVGDIVGLAMQRIVQWDNYKEGKIGGGLAEKWEQPDGQTIVLKLRPNTFFHNKPPVNGRAATVEDIKFHIERNRDGKLQDGTPDPNFYRQPYYANVDSVTATDASTVTIKLKTPSPLFFNLLAQPFEGIQAPEAVKQFEKDYAQFNEKLIIGTGPYVLTEFSPEGRLKFKKFDKFSGKTNFNGVNYVPLFTDEAARQAAWEQKQIDVHGPSTTQVLNELKSRYSGKIQDIPNFSANPIIAGSYYIGSAPWNNENLLGAIFRGYDRRQLIQQFHGGRGAVSGSVPPQHGSFALSEKELINYPGYLENRDTENNEARKMWAAGGGPALGEVTLDIPDIFEGSYQAASILVAMLNKNLGVTQFKAKVEPYATITSKIVQQKYGNGNAAIWYGWDTDILDPEPASFLIANYKSDSPQAKQTFGLKIDALDAVLTKLGAELDQAKRRELTHDAEKLLLKAYGAGRAYSHVAITNTLAWNYYHPREAAPFNTAHLIVNAWIDPSDPTYQGRAADENA
ncbi:MAG: ABC transporter substrate-binding protein [Dehalococcoidia bacterium]|nr:ABC transporter substrate-binding protein [Dehalococcoidia bacterium]